MPQLFRQLDLLAADRWAQRGLRRLLRAATLGLSIWCIGIGGRLLWGWPLRADALGALALVPVGVAALVLLRPRLRPLDAARRLDRRFHLDEQLATAVEVAGSNPPPESVAARLLAESGEVARLLRRRLARHRHAPWNDLLTLALLGLVALGLAIIAGVGRPEPVPGQLAIPPLVAPGDPAQQLPDEPFAGGQPTAGEPGQGQPAAGDTQVIAELADALRDEGLTRPAAEALDQGDLAGAARALRELADQAGQLDQAARDRLAERLRAAAEAIGDRSPELADQLERSADGLERGGAQAAEALEDLADTIEDLPTAPADQAAQGEQPGQAGEQPGQGGDGGAAGEPAAGPPPAAGDGGGLGEGGGPGAGDGGLDGEQQPAPATDRMGVEGQPVPLDTTGPGELPADPSSPLGQGAGPTRPGFTQGDSAAEQQVDTAADPLRVPLDERDVVQEYFQP